MKGDKMKVTRTRVKQYNSTYKTVISVDDEPVAITRSEQRAADIEAYLNGYDIVISDGKLKNTLDYYRERDSFKKKKNEGDDKKHVKNKSR